MINTNTLDALVELVLKSHSFEFETFQEAKHTIDLGEGIMPYTYDRLSLRTYYPTLSDAEFCYFGRKMSSKYATRFSREHDKRRLEYGTATRFRSFAWQQTDWSRNN